MLAGADTPMPAWNSALGNSTATLMRSKNAVVIAIRSTTDIAQRKACPACAGAAGFTDASPASCTRAPSRDRDHRASLVGAASPGAPRRNANCKTSCNKAILLKQREGRAMLVGDASRLEKRHEK